MTYDPFEYRMQLHNYGPFDMENGGGKWLIVGSGPSGDLAMGVSGLGAYRVISLNFVLKFMEEVEVAFINHYEPMVSCMGELGKARWVYLPSPTEVGYRCIPVDPINLYDFNYFEKEHPGRIRFYRKESDFEVARASRTSLYAKESVVTAAVDLLSRNGVKEFYYCGIDGGGVKSVETPRAESMADFYNRFDSAYTFRGDYDRNRAEFLWFCSKVGVKPIALEGVA